MEALDELFMPIALDLETTGFEAEKDQIIEIAALKFEGDQLIDTFETFLNPEIPIPDIVTHITGIKAENLTNAPKFADIKKKLADFIGNEAIVGHNIGFDVTFLNHKGMSLQNELYDTLPLASMLFPGLPSYSLDTLSRIFKITHLEKHRARSDAHASLELFWILQKKLRSIAPESLTKIQELLGRSEWPLRKLFFGIENQAATAGPLATTAETISHGDQTTVPHTESIVTTANIAPPDQTITPHIKDNVLQQKIFDTLSQNRHLLIEAGYSGNAKNLDILAGAARFSLEQNQKIIIATRHEKTEENLMINSLTLLQKNFPDLQTASLKSPKHYLSLLRLRRFKAKPSFTSEETIFLIKILLWLEETKTGDFHELTMQGKEFSFLEEICCTKEACDHTNENDCFFYKNFLEAQKANLLFIDQKLLIQNELSTKILPHYGHLIIFEAHALEKTLDEVFHRTLSVNWFQKPFQKLLQLLEERQKEHRRESKQTTVDQTLFEMTRHLEQFFSKTDIFFGLIGIFAEKQIHPSNIFYHLVLKPSDRESVEWQRVAATGTTLLDLGKEIIRNVMQMLDIPEHGSNPQLSLNFEEESSDLTSEMRHTVQECRERLDDLEPFFQAGSDQYIFWLYKTHEEHISLQSGHKSAGAFLSEHFYPKKKSIILVSEHMAVGENFHYIRRELEIPANAEEIIWPENTTIFEKSTITIPKNLPAPSSPGFLPKCFDMIASTIIKNQGRTMVLFTSKKALTAAYRELASHLKETGYNILAHRITGGKGKILENFKDEPEVSAIFAFPNFWEEIDTSEFTCLILQKLCFDPPDDPLVSVRSQKYTDGFKEYFLPRAVLQFKQTFYQLLKNKQNQGHLLVLDTRLLQNSYGPVFLDSLPKGVKIETKTVEEMVNKTESKVKT